MRLAVIVCLILLAALTTGLPGRPDDSRFLKAHAAAVRYHAQARLLQARLTVRVLQVHRLERSLAHRPSSVEALGLAAVAYHVDFRLLYRVASCESTGGAGLNPNAKNRSSTAAGLGQFLDSTWASSPYARFSVYSPYANALAIAREVAAGNAGWQWAASRGCWS